MAGHFVVSLDLELHWGVRDHTPVDEYRDALLGVWEAVPRILELFADRSVRATWAVVGLLLAKDRDELDELLPSARPRYRDPALDPYRALDEVGNSEHDDPFHYAPSLVEQVAATPGQELATHTFSHFYALEPGPSLDTFVADLAAARAIAARRGLPAPRSIVFPRNQYGEEHLAVLPGCGIVAYRGHAPGVFERPAAVETAMRKAARLVDSYVPLALATTRAVRHAALPLVNVPASRFLRPWAAARAALDAVRLARITRSMTAAARSGADFHLWWHPHNFGAHPTENVAFLARILDHYDTLQRTYGMRSANMADRADGLGV